MAKALFFCENIDENADEIIINGEEARHISGARRLQVGNTLALTDGNGLSAQAQITSLEKKSVVLRVLCIHKDKQQSPKIIIASALPKGDRQSDMLDQCTQLGMDAFIPLTSQYSVTKPKDNQYERFKRIIRSAGKQSQRRFFPQVMPVSSLIDLLQSCAHDTQLFFADQNVGHSLFQLNQGIIPAQQKWLCLIGPEGGFSAQEIELIMQKNPIALKLSAHILRTETAAAMSTAMLQQMQMQKSQ